MTRHSSFAPLRIPIFRALWLANIVSSFGWLIQGVGAAWLMTQLSTSANMVALVQTAITLPIMLFSLMSGALADSFDRRKVMLAAQLFMFSISSLLAVFAFMDLLTDWMLLVFSFFLGCGVAFNNPSWQASVGDIVPKDQLSSAVLLNGAGFNVIRSVAPAIGGFIVAVAGAGATFVINAVSYVGLVSVVLRWLHKEPAEPNASREPLSSAMTAGVRFVALSPRISKVLLRGFIFGLSGIVLLALLPIITKDMVGGGPVMFGVLLGAYGVGAVGGAFVAPRIVQRLSREGLVRWMFMAAAVSTSVIAVSQWAWLTAAAMVVSGGAWVISLSQLNTTVQLSTPRWVVGRALSLYQMSIFGGMALGGWVWGVTADAYSPSTALLASAGVMLVGSAVGLLVPLPPDADLNLDPLNRWREPDVALTIEPRSGPVSVAVEYFISEKNQAAFQALMGERKVARRRNGAQNWTLYRDLSDAERWMERFEVETWADYLRFHQRTTHEDAAVASRIRALHNREELPKVERSLIRDPARSRIHGTRSS